MINNGNHIGIETIRWDLHVPSVDHAREWHEKASKFTKNRIGIILQEALRPFSSYQGIIDIDSLELQLGNSVTEETLEEEIRKALSEKVKEISLLKRIPVELLAGKEIAHTKVNYFFQFEQYLKTGLHYHSGNSYSLQNSKLYFDALAEMNDDTIISWLKDKMKLPDTGIRLLEFFSFEETVQLFSRLISNSAALQRSLNLINKLMRAAKLFIPGLINSYHQYRLYLLPAHFTEREYVVEWWKEIISIGLVSDREKSKLQDFLQKYSEHYSSQSQALFSTTELSVLEHLVQSNRSAFFILSDAATKDKTAPLPADSGSALSEHPVFIENAGAILLYPYLRKIFNGNGWLNEQNDFFHHSFQQEASYYLQYIVTGKADVKEYELLLNKLLCGYPPDAPVSRNWNPEKAQIEVANSILKEVIGNWSKLGNTSPEGFRNSFLLRPGKLKEEENNWILWVERRGWDILLDGLPYPISIIKLPWMIKPLFVQW